MTLFKTITVVSYFLLLTQSCTSQKDINDTLVIVKRGETVKVKGLDLKITNKGCGREWVSDGGESYEKPVCELAYVLGDSTKYGGRSYKPVYFGDIEISIEKMNVWNKEEDGVPGGACRLWIRKLKQPDATGK